MATSLGRRLAVWLLAPLALLALLNAVLAYLAALSAVNQAYDRSLTASIKAIAENTHSLEGKVQVDIPASAFGIFDDGVQERIFYAVLGPDGEMITGYPDLRAPQRVEDDGRISIADSVYGSEPVRIGALRKRMYDPDMVGGDSITIIFAETTESRIDLARKLFLDSLRRQLLLIVLGAVLLTLALRSALRPLLKLRDAVQQRSEEDLTTIKGEGVLSEVRPLIDAINFHTERLSALIAARKRFLADAAHQIRTPLALLTTQAEVGLRQQDVAEMRATFNEVLKTVKNTRRMTNQMLALSQAESADNMPREHALIDLTALARDTAMELAPVALQRHIALALEPSPSPALVLGDAEMLHELIANLIHNASLYSPSESQVVVATCATNDRVVLTVTDEGPGIPVEERPKVFRRFYRVLGQGNSDGSGLGLAIVKQIAEVHGATVQLNDGPGGRGLQVEVAFPCQ